MLLPVIGIKEEIVHYKMLLSYLISCFGQEKEIKKINGFVSIDLVQQEIEIPVNRMLHMKSYYWIPAKNEIPKFHYKGSVW